MKKIALLFGFLLLLFSAAACTQKDNPSEEETLLKYNRYTLQTYTKPLWSGNVVYNETLMFVGKEDSAPFLYPATELISVRSYDLLTEYEEGKDYTFSDNKIALTENTRIPFFTLEEYYPSQAVSGQTFVCTVPGHNLIRFSEGAFFSQRQIAVTYRHNAALLPAPQTQSQKFQSFLSKVKAGEAVCTVFYGDSITTGANSSNVIGSGPFADSWTKMTVDYLSQKYNNPNIEYYNTAVGGMATAWGEENINSRMIGYEPDLAVIAFGMNDAGTSVQTYKSLIESMIVSIQTNYPNAAILLVSTMLPNSEVAGFYGNQIYFEECLIELSQTYQNVAIAPVTTMHGEVLKVKRYYDMTGNNVNHPNDFLARLYTQTILHTMLGEEYTLLK